MRIFLSVIDFYVAIEKGSFSVALPLFLNPPTPSTVNESPSWVCLCFWRTPRQGEAAKIPAGPAPRTPPTPGALALLQSWDRPSSSSSTPTGTGAAELNVMRAGRAPAGALFYGMLFMGCQCLKTQCAMSQQTGDGPGRGARLVH